jgi:inner membrane protein YidH
VENKRPQEHLANERTFLAWIRTSVAIMAFGFVVVRFSLFLTQLSMMLNKSNLDDHKEYSAIAGNILVVAGMLTTLLGYIRYRKAEKQISRNSFESSPVAITLLTCFILLVSLCLIVFLLLKI